MKRVWYWFVYIFILTVYPLMVGVFFFQAEKEVYLFWKYGNEKIAYVAALDSTTPPALVGHSNFYYGYKLEIESSMIVACCFTNKLPIGENIKVLTLESYPERVLLGTKNSSLFEIYSYKTGGIFSAILGICGFLFMVFGSPIVFVYLIKTGRNS